MIIVTFSATSHEFEMKPRCLLIEVLSSSIWKVSRVVAPGDVLRLCLHLVMASRVVAHRLCNVVRQEARSFFCIVQQLVEVIHGCVRMQHELRTRLHTRGHPRLHVRTKEPALDYQQLAVGLGGSGCGHGCVCTCATRWSRPLFAHHARALGPLRRKTQAQHRLHESQGLRSSATLKVSST